MVLTFDVNVVCFCVFLCNNLLPHDNTWIHRSDCLSSPTFLLLLLLAFIPYSRRASDMCVRSHDAAPVYRIVALFYANNIEMIPFWKQKVQTNTSEWARCLFAMCSKITWPSGAHHRTTPNDFPLHYDVKMTFSNIACPQSTIWMCLEGQKNWKKKKLSIICISLDMAQGWGSEGAEIFITAFWSFHLSSHLLQMNVVEADVRLFKDSCKWRIDSFFSFSPAGKCLSPAVWPK